MFLVSYATDPLVFSVFFGISLGLLSCCCAIPSIWISWSVLPQAKGTSVGIVLASYSMAPFIYGSLFTLFVNPNEVQALSEINSTDTYFSAEVTDYVPFAIRVFSSCLLVSGLIGCVLLNCNDIESSAPKNTKTMTVKEFITNTSTWQLFFMSFLNVIGFFYLINVYKDISMKRINDDYFLAVVGALSFVLIAIGRFVFGSLMDKYSWKKIVLSSLAVQIVGLVFMDFALENKYVFAVVFFICSFSGSAMLGGSMVIIERTYPEDRWTLGYILLSLILSIFTIYGIRKLITPAFGEFFSFLTVAGYLVIGVLLVINYKIKGKKDL
jgi:hypothetical protein